MAQVFKGLGTYDLVFLTRLASVFETQSKSCRSSCLEFQIINMKLKKNQQKFPVLLQSCRPQTGGPVGISNTG